nr:MAG TPA: hypothetical protein [Caudoviricetes sp.]
MIELICFTSVCTTAILAIIMITLINILERR